MRVVLFVVLDDFYDFFIIQLGCEKLSFISFYVHIAKVNGTLKNVFIDECFISCQVYNKFLMPNSHKTITLRLWAGHVQKRVQ